MRFGEIAKAADQLGKLVTPVGGLRGRLRFGVLNGRDCRGRARLRPLAGIGAMKGGDVAAARHFNDQRIVASAPRIIARQRLAHASGLDAHDGIGLRIKIGAAAERFHGDGVRLEFVAVTRERHFDNEG